MATCKDCLHFEACNAWILHGKTLYSDFDYSTEDCPIFKDRTKWVEQKQERCKWCNGDYHTTILATAIRHHSNGNMEGYELSVNYCPNCGADMREGRVGE